MGFEGVSDRSTSSSWANFPTSDCLGFRGAAAVIAELGLEFGAIRFHRSAREFDGSLPWAPCSIHRLMVSISSGVG